MWEPREGGSSWQIDQRPFSSHSKSVEDLQWSPTEATVCLQDSSGIEAQTEAQLMVPAALVIDFRSVAF